MSQIVVEDLIKTYRVAERRPGLRGAAFGLFRRTYREVRALDRLTFSIERGSLVGYIGPNGAGKSTTVKILAGILVPDGGRCTIDGRIPWQDRIAHVARLGVVFGQRTQLWWDLPVIESFDLLRDIYRVAEIAYRQRRDELVDALSLSPLLDTPVRQLSLGQRMRCELAAALLHAPDLLFLDEPTIGLDAVAKLAVRDFIKRLNAAYGMTVILTTHDMNDVEELCDRVMVIGHGSILCDGTLAQLRERVSSQRRLIIDLEADASAVQDPDASVVLREKQRVHLQFDPSVVAPAKLIARVTQAYAVRDLFLEQPAIETIVAQLYAEAERSAS